METSDDDGESDTAATLAKASLIFLFCLPATLYKPHYNTQFSHTFPGIPLPEKKPVVTDTLPKATLPKNKKKPI